MMQDLLTALITLRLYAHQCHVLVTGNDALHTLLGVLYETADDCIDPVAESLTAAGQTPTFVPSTFPSETDLDELIQMAKSIEEYAMDSSLDLIDQQIATECGAKIRSVRNRLEHHVA